jgi:hypothetical protein
MDAHVKLTLASIIVGLIGVIITGMSNDSDSGDKAKRLGYFLMGLGLASILILLAMENPQEIRQLGHRAVVFCGFGG